MLNDPMSAVGSRDRIRAMQSYLAAYRNGTQLPDQVVLPGMRLSSSSDQTSSSISGGPSATYNKNQFL